MKAKTAAEFLRELEADPELRANRQRQERELTERATVHAADERELVTEIRAAGYEVDSVYDLVNNTPHPVLPRKFIGPYPRAYPALLRHLDMPHGKPIREGIIRALTVRDGGPEVEAALFRAFSKEDHPDLRWVLANALKVAMPYHRRRKHPEIAAVFAGQPVGTSDRPSNER